MRGAHRYRFRILGASLLAGGLTLAASAQGGRGQPPPPTPVHSYAVRIVNCKL